VTWSQPVRLRPPARARAMPPASREMRRMEELFNQLLDARDLRW
jgi:hypothetical protein